VQFSLRNWDGILSGTRVEVKGIYSDNVGKKYGFANLNKRNYGERMLSEIDRSVGSVYMAEIAGRPVHCVLCKNPRFSLHYTGEQL
jgi:hypothetical protein